MEKNLFQGRKSAAVLHYFETISAIPRGSYHEEKIADYLMTYAQKHGFSAERDESNNVLIRVPAAPGMEQAAPLLVQGHTDMVCEKNKGTAHDFLNDPLRLTVDGNFLRAEGTTLGADDGIAVAVMLALMDGEIARHPAYECLFTSMEEVGLIGAHRFDCGKLTARRLLNLDNADLGMVIAGCSGGARTDLTLAFQPEEFQGECVRVRVSGLIGGHSGENIKDGRANANDLMGRLLSALLSAADARLVSLNGGSKVNAIARECEALLAVADAETAERVLTEEAMRLGEDLSREDRGFSVMVEQAEAEAVMMKREDTRRAVGLICCAATGVLAMSHDVAGLVETSRNLGVIESEEGKIVFHFSTRSSSESKLDASERELDLLAGMTGCRATEVNRYPGWRFSAESPLREAFLRSYAKVTGENATVNLIHAGLECGEFASQIPNLDMISVGPTVKNLHSPDEAMDLDSVDVLWSVLEDMIPNL